MGKVMGNSGDWTGNIKFEQWGNYIKLEITQPTGPVPMMNKAVVYKGKILGYEQIPVIASINNSRVNSETWSGISKAIRSVGSVIGTVLAGMIGIESTKQIGNAVTAWAPKEATQAATTTIVPEVPVVIPPVTP